MINALFLVEIYGLQDIIDSLGYETGEQLLTDTSNVIRKLFHSTDILCRRGSNQFILLIKNIHPIELISVRAAELANSLRFLYVQDGRGTNVAGIVGASIWQSDAPKTLNQMIHECEAALSNVRKMPEKGFEIYDSPGEIKENESLMLSYLTRSNGFNIQMGAILENMDGGILIVEVDDKIKVLYASPSYFKLVNSLSEEEMASSEWPLKNIYSDDVEVISSVIRDCATKGEAADTVYRVSKNYWRQARAVPFKVSTEDRKMLLIILTDISDIRHDILEDRLNNKKMETILEISKLISFEVDISTHELIVPKTFMDKLGWSSDVTTNIPDSLIEAGLISHKTDKVFVEKCEEVFAGVPEGWFSTELKNLNTNTFERIRLSWKLVLDDYGNPVRAVGVGERELMINDSKEVTNIREMQKQLALQQKYYERANQYQQELRRYRHDRKNNVVAMLGFLRNKDIDGAVHYLTSMHDIIRAESELINTENPALDAVLTEKIVYAKNQGIEVEHTIGISPDVNVDPKDLCLAVGCCIDNAIEACIRSKDEVPKTQIQLKLIEQKNVIVFNMTNTSVPLDLEFDESGIPKSSKKNTQNHGFGLKNLKEIIEKYNGFLELHQTEDKTFVTQFTIFVDLEGD